MFIIRAWRDVLLLCLLSGQFDLCHSSGPSPIVGFRERLVPGQNCCTSSGWGLGGLSYICARTECRRPGDGAFSAYIKVANEGGQFYCQGYMGYSPASGGRGNGDMSVSFDPNHADSRVRNGGPYTCATGGGRPDFPFEKNGRGSFYCICAPYWPVTPPPTTPPPTTPPPTTPPPTTPPPTTPPPTTPPPTTPPPTTPPPTTPPPTTPPPTTPTPTRCTSHDVCSGNTYCDSNVCYDCGYCLCIANDGVDGTCGPCVAANNPCATPPPTHRRIQTMSPITNRPTPPPTPPPTPSPTFPLTGIPTMSPTTNRPTMSPTTLRPTLSPTSSPTQAPSTSTPTSSPSMIPSMLPTISTPTVSPSENPTTSTPSAAPTVSQPTLSPTESSVCYVVGNSHHQTFDEHWYDFQGQCSYSLLADCRNEPSTFEVQVQHSNRPIFPAPQITTITGLAVKLPTEMVLEFTSYNAGMYFIDGETNIGPFSDSSGNSLQVTDTQNPIYTLTVESLGLTLVWDARYAVQVWLHGTSPLRDSCLTGLCGNFDHDYFNDIGHVSSFNYWKVLPNTNGTLLRAPDRRRKQIFQSSVSLFLNDSGCEESHFSQHTRLCTGTARTSAREFCAAFLDDTYRSCHDKVDPQPHYDNCIYDHCNSNTSVACASYRLYENLCSYRGVSRDSFVVPVVESITGSCYATESPTIGPSVPPTAAPSSVPSSAPTAVPSTIPSKAPTSSPSATPTSSPSSIPTSTPSMFPSSFPTVAPTLAADINFTCYSSGDPHYLTFAGLRYSFMGQCEYLLAREVDSVTGLEIHSQNSERSSNQVTYTVGVSIVLPMTNDRVEFSRFHSGRINSDPLPIPYTDTAGNTVVRQSRGRSVLSAPAAGVKIVFYSSGAVMIVALGNSTLRDNTEGLCGAFDGNSSTDASHVELNDFWIANETSGECTESTVPGGVTTCNASSRLDAIEFCRRLFEDPYTMCHEILDPLPFYEECVFDHCEDGRLACSSFALYEDMCEERGIFLGELSVVDEIGMCSEAPLREVCTGQPSETPTTSPTFFPSSRPSSSPSIFPTSGPTPAPSSNPTAIPSTVVLTRPPSEQTTTSPSVPLTGSPVSTTPSPLPTMSPEFRTTTDPGNTISSDSTFVSSTGTGCVRNCGQPENGGGTCLLENSSYCTSCNDGHLLTSDLGSRVDDSIKGNCISRITCDRRVIVGGRFDSARCTPCLDRHCFKCKIHHLAGDANPSEVCLRCRDGYYLVNGTCSAECPPTQTLAGANLFGRRCMDPFTCRSGRILNYTDTKGCKCPNPLNSAMDHNCHTCEFRAGEFGQRCTKCRNGKFLFNDSCHDDCSVFPGTIPVFVGQFGSYCVGLS